MPKPIEPTASGSGKQLSKTIPLFINGEKFAHDGESDMPLLWYLRDVLDLTGTKYACDSGVCGACTVLVDGKATLACQVAMSTLAGAEVTTIEGLADRWRMQQRAKTLAVDALHPLQAAFVSTDAIQCGYCQPGFLMASAALLERESKPDDADIDKLGNLCRCGIYPRIRAAIKLAARIMREQPT